MVTNLTSPVRLSSKLTLLSFFATPIFGLLIGFVIASKTFYVWWGLLISLAVAGYAIYFAFYIADASLQDEMIILKKPLRPSREVPMKDVQRVRKFVSRRHNYFFFTCTDHSFLLVSPLSGPGRQALEDIYNVKKKV